MTVPHVIWEHCRTLPEPFKRRVKLNERWRNWWSMKPDIMWGCHGDQTLHSRQGYCAPFCWLEQALAYPIVAVFMQTEDAVRTQTFHWGNHAIYSRSQETTQHCKREAFSGYLFGLFKYCFQCNSWIVNHHRLVQPIRRLWVGKYCSHYKNVQLRHRHEHLVQGITESLW